MIHRLMLALSLAVCLMSGPAATAYAAASSTYTITIPSTLDVQNAGWNELSGGVSASGTLEDGKALVITASSDNGFKFVKDDDAAQTVSYDFRASSADTTAITSWKFDSLGTSAVTQTAGIFVEDYTDKPGGTYTETVTFTAEVKSSIVDLSTLAGDYKAQDGDVLTGTAGEDAHITVAAGATITLKNANITSISSSNSWAGITPSGDATIILEGTNAVKGGNADYPGVFIAPDYTLTLKGSGSLTASSNGYGPGIGGGYEIACGNIEIQGGTITATGGSGGAGIGGGSTASCGTITISGGTVKATGGDFAAGIGSGSGSSCGNITITTGATSVTATAGGETWETNQHSIGASSNGLCDEVTIGGTVYWDGSSYQNGGDTYLTQSTITYKP